MNNNKNPSKLSEEDVVRYAMEMSREMVRAASAVVERNNLGEDGPALMGAAVMHLAYCIDAARTQLRDDQARKN